MVELSEKSRLLGELLAEDLGNGKKVYGAYLGRAYKSLRKLEDAEDLVSEFYKRAIERVDTYRFPITSLEDNRLGYWLSMVFNNFVTDCLRKKMRSRTQVQINENICFSQAEEGPVDEAIRRENERILEKEIKRLPERYTELIIMYDLMDLSCREIAELTGRKYTTTKGRIFTARKKLKRKLELIEI